MNWPITDPHYGQKLQLADTLRQVLDPELNINIVDLGLVYGIDIDEEQKEIVIRMTLSTPSCPIGGILTKNAELAAADASPGYAVKVTLVWEPRWSYDSIPEAGKAALGWKQAES